MVVKHLDNLTDEFIRYFPNLSKESWQFTLTSCPFKINVNTLPDALQEQAIELKYDSSAKINFDSGSSSEGFWLKYLPTYTKILNEALKVLVQFLSTYICESEFSSRAVIKTKHRNRLEVESDLRCSLSNIKPNVKNIVQRKVLSVFALIDKFTYIQLFILFYNYYLQYKISHSEYCIVYW